MGGDEFPDEHNDEIEGYAQAGKPGFTTKEISLYSVKTKRLAMCKTSKKRLDLLCSTQLVEKHRPGLLRRGLFRRNFRNLPFVVEPKSGAGAKVVGSLNSAES